MTKAFLAVFFCVWCQVKEEASQARSSDTLHVDPTGLVTLTTPNRLSTISVRAIPLPQGEPHTQRACMILDYNVNDLNVFY